MSSSGNVHGWSELNESFVKSQFSICFSISNWSTIESLQRKVIYHFESQKEVLFLKKQNVSIRQLQSSSTTMASATDSARITSMAKRRKTKTKSGKSIHQISHNKIYLINFNLKFLHQKQKLILNFQLQPKILSKKFIMHI